MNRKHWLGLLFVGTLAAGCSGDAGDAPDTSVAGPWGVYRVETVPDVPVGGDRKTNVTLCLPSSDGGVTAAPGPHPLVIENPGFAIRRWYYDSYCRHLASWGYAVVLQDYSLSAFNLKHASLAEDLSALIDWALSGEAGFQADPDRVAAVGHSMGGKVSFLAATNDARIRAVVGWDPVDAGEPSVAPERMGLVKVPFLVLGETLDEAAGPFGQSCAPAGDNYTTYFDAAAGDAVEITVHGASHLSWTNPDEEGEENCGLTCEVCNPATVAGEAVRSLTRRTTVAFLDRHLRGDRSMDDWISGEGIGADAASGFVTVRSK